MWSKADAVEKDFGNSGIVTEGSESQREGAGKRL